MDRRALIPSAAFSHESMLHLVLERALLLFAAGYHLIGLFIIHDNSNRLSRLRGNDEVVRYTCCCTLSYAEHCPQLWNSQ